MWHTCCGVASKAHTAHDTHARFAAQKSRARARTHTHTHTDHGLRTCGCRQIGANKGYNIAEFLALWTQRNLTSKLWHKAILRVAHEQHSRNLYDMSCGVCRVCHTAPLAVPHHRDGGTVHAFEVCPDVTNHHHSCHDFPPWFTAMISCHDFPP